MHLLCRLCAAVFRRSGSQSHRLVSFRIGGWAVGKIWVKGEAIEKMARAVWLRSGGDFYGNWSSICQDCYEVSEDVILEFQKAFEEKYWEKLFYKKEEW